MKTVTRYTGGHTGPYDLVLASDYDAIASTLSALRIEYDSLHKDYTQAVAAVAYLLVAFNKALEGKPVRNADEVIAHAETVLNKR